MMKRNSKTAYIVMGITIIVLSISLIFAMLQIKKLKPTRFGLQGYFQASVREGNAAPGYRANFDPYKGNTYYISYMKDEEIISEGTYEKVNDALYILTDQSGEKQTITLLHDKFYYYDEEMDYIVEFVANSNGVPTYFIRGEEVKE